MKINYISIWQQKRSLIDVEAHIHQYLYHRDIVGSTHTHSFIFAQEGIAEEFHREIDNQKWIRKGSDFLKKKFVLKLLAQGKALRSDFQAFLRQLQCLDLVKLSNTELSVFFLKGYQYHSRYRAFFKTSRPEFLSIAEKRLKKLLRKNTHTKNMADKSFEILTSPSEFDEVDYEFNDWLKLLAQAQLSEYNINKHLKRYTWLVAHTYNQKIIMEMMNNRFGQDKKKLLELQHEFNDKVNYKKSLLSSRRGLLKRINNPEAAYLSWLFRELSVERMRLKGGWAGSDFYYYSLFREIERRTKIFLSDLYSCYRVDEVIKALRSGEHVRENELQRRKRAYVLCLNNGLIYFKSGTVAVKIAEQALEKFHSISKTELTGQIACLGKALGKAHIVIPGNLDMLLHDLKSFQQGEILITTMTQPNMVPIMKKAAAIVTDEGGITSHAAIISREFKIPCIVGTQRATKIFRNGDQVMVNADSGTVSKIKNTL